MDSSMVWIEHVIRVMREYLERCIFLENIKYKLLDKRLFYLCREFPINKTEMMDPPDTELFCGRKCLCPTFLGDEGFFFPRMTCFPISKDAANDTFSLERIFGDGATRTYCLIIWMGTKNNNGFNGRFL